LNPTAIKNEERLGIRICLEDRFRDAEVELRIEQKVKKYAKRKYTFLSTHASFL